MQNSPESDLSDTPKICKEIMDALKSKCNGTPDEIAQRITSNKQTEPSSIVRTFSQIKTIGIVNFILLLIGIALSMYNVCQITKPTHKNHGRTNSNTALRNISIAILVIFVLLFGMALLPGFG